MEGSQSLAVCPQRGYEDFGSFLSLSLLPGHQEVNRLPLSCASTTLCCHRFKATQLSGGGLKSSKLGAKVNFSSL